MLAHVENSCTLFKAVFSLIYQSNFDLIFFCLINSFRALDIIVIVCHICNNHPAGTGFVYLPNLVLIRMGLNHIVK